ncbi:hypothetical protein OGATHE_006293 [Ogataea polymorpha]|uniref:DASH complex subunit DUO1 n=1 Tax=Ogataea polymorpha TaxID=460523 RepID=A0A9P8NU36_9ASCO|nr:hypothetical protein OGATHE_006293 [Ogataea polymorpha]
MSQEITPALNSLEEVITSPPRSHEKDRETAIRAELEKLQKINGAIDQSRISIQESTNYIKRIKESTIKANELIHIWSKILSQNKHTAELLADPHNVWQGASHEDEKVQDKMAEYEELAARSPASTLSFSCTITSPTLPETGELITISIFIALRTHNGSPFLTSTPGWTRTSITTPAIGAPTSFGLCASALGRVTVSTAASLSSTVTFLISPLNSKYTSLVPVCGDRSPMAITLMTKVLPCSISTEISSFSFGGARKNLVGSTERSPYFSWIFLNDSNTFGYMLYEATSHSVMELPNLDWSSSLIFLRSNGSSSNPGLRVSFLLFPARIFVLKGSGNPPYGVPIKPSKKSSTESGKSSSEASLSTSFGESLLETMNWARSPTTLEVGVTLTISPKSMLASSLEARVQQSHLGPISINLPGILLGNAGVDLVVQGSNERAHGRLRCQARHRVDSTINNVRTSKSTSNIGNHTGTGRVVGVDVDRNRRILLSDTADQQLCRGRLQSTGHVLDTKQMGAHLHNLVDGLQVVLEIVFLAWLEHVSRVANSGFDHTSGLLDGVDADLQLLQIVQSIKDSENVHSGVLSLLHKVVYGVVRQRRVRHTIRSSQKHLEWDVWHGFSQLSESVPRILVQETHSNVESGTSPTFQGEGVSKGMGRSRSNVQQVYGSNSGCQKRLVSVSPGSVHDQATIESPNLVGKLLRTVVQKVLSKGFWRRSVLDIDIPAVNVVDHRDVSISGQLWQTNLALDRRSVDTEIGKVREQLLSSVLGLHHLEQRRSVVDECRPAVARNERWMGQKSQQERNVGLDTSNSELNQSPDHLSSGNLVV